MEFQKLLLDVGQNLKAEEVKALGFLCTDLLDHRSTSVEESNDLFSRLAEKDLLTAEHPQLLTELLLIIQRPSLVKKLNLSQETRGSISEFRKLLYNLSENITDKVLRDIKFLLPNDLNRRKLERCTTALAIFHELECMDKLSCTNLELLERLMQTCPILLEKIRRFKETQVHTSGLVTQEKGRPRRQSYPFEEKMDRPDFGSLCKASSEVSVNCGDDRQEMSYQTSGLSAQLGGLDISEDANNASERIPGENHTAASQMTCDLTKSPNQTTNDKGSSQVLESYPMIAAKRGICLIINNEDFSKAKDKVSSRKGTMIDEDCLSKVFEWLGFDIEIHQNRSGNQMLALIQELSQRDYSQMDCLVCCVLSHGLEGVVYGVDGCPVRLQELKELLNGSRCPSLAEKPKLFFIQACQGKKNQNPVVLTKNTDDIFSDEGSFQESIPAHAHFLMAMSTVPSYVSFRDERKGTWFIQSLCQNLIELVPRGFDLMSILTKVNADVSKMSNVTGRKKQMPEPSFCLTKTLIFPIPSDPAPSIPR